MAETLRLPYRISMLYKLGQRLSSLDGEGLDQLCSSAAARNNWFTKANVKNAIDGVASMLSKENLDQWTSNYNLSPIQTKTVGLVMAGNIPMVGFHDLMSVLIAGHKAKVKLSSQDEVLMTYLINQLKSIEPGITKRIEIVDRLTEIDAVIATGSDNSARYFKHYFGKIPHIIRQNRISIGILNGSESKEALMNLGEDIFQYYGLGCRNVSKLFVPDDFDLVTLIDALMPFEKIIDHHKFRNNYDYNKSIYLVNRESHLDSGFFLMRQSEELVSPISVIFYETYSTEAALALKLSANRDKIQAITSEDGWFEGSIPFGTAQCPAPWDYADGIDTLEFLETL